MKFTTSLFATALIATVASMPIKRAAVDPALVPELGVTAGVNPTGTGDCDGVNGVKIPCTCPPDRQTFIGLVQKNVDAGKVVNNPSVPFSFPTDNSKASQLARINAATVTLQNFNGPGKGCPQASTTLGAQQAAIQAGGAAPAAASPAAASPAAASPAPAAASPAPAPASSAAAPAASPAAGATLSSSGNGALLPPFGITPNTNPTGTGDCDGAGGVKIPCACPPDVNTFLNSLNANVAAGHAVNNPSVAVSFPTGADKASQSARLTAGLITLQNLNGSGKGCPAVSTNWVALQKTLQ